MKQFIFKSPPQIPTRKNTLILLLLTLTLAPSIAIGAENQNTAPASSDASTHKHHHTIFVTGIGETSAAPNQAVVRFGMTAQNSRAAVAQSKVNEVIQKATAAIIKAGVQRHFIHTARLSLTPVYADKLLSSGGSKVSSFRADNVLEATVGEVIDAAINAGANEVQGVYFRLQDDREERRDALTRASQQAKAELIAQSLGVSLGNVIEATETAYSPITLESAGPSSLMSMSRKEMAHTPVRTRPNPNPSPSHRPLRNRPQNSLTPTTSRSVLGVRRCPSG